jgi:hypothetical protein
MTVAALPIAGIVPPSFATIQGDVVCWYPDVETPVACDDDDD